MRKLVGIAVVLFAAACGGREQQGAARSSALRRARERYVTPADTVLLKGVYRRDKDEATLRLCGTTATYQVAAVDSILLLLDANVDWRALRPTTTMYAEVRGDTSRAVRESAVNGTLAIVGVDSMSTMEPGQCTPRRPSQPPAAVPAEVAGALRAALGADSGLAVPPSYRGTALWLDNDFHGDLLVLARAPRLCELAGCTLFVFRGTPSGYQFISRTAGVVGPIQVRRWPDPDRPNGEAQEATEGYVDLQVKVNGGAFGLRDAILRYRGGRYPRDANFEPPPGGRRGNALPFGTTVLP